MYIRRKVFSLLEIEGEERLFSTTDINLEDAEERIFSLNEDAEEYLFSESEDDKEMSTGKKIALGTGATVGTLAAVGLAAKKGLLGSKAAQKVNMALMKGFKNDGKIYKGAVKDLEKAFQKDKTINKNIKDLADDLAKKGYDKHTIKNIITDAKRDSVRANVNAAKYANPGEKNIIEKAAEKADRTRRKVKVAAYKYMKNKKSK